MRPREWCVDCRQASAIGFAVPDAVWLDVVPRGFRDTLCIGCFARRADEKLIAWDRDITFYPVSLATAHELAAPSAPPRDAP